MATGEKFSMITANITKRDMDQEAVEKEMKAWESRPSGREAEEKAMKAWEKEEKKIRKEQEKWMKKGGRW